MFGLHLYAAVQPLVAQPIAQWTAGARSAPGLPCALFHLRVGDKAKLGRDAARMRSCVCNEGANRRSEVVAAYSVVASAAKQSRNVSAEGFWIASLRSQRCGSRCGPKLRARAPGRCAARSDALHSPGPCGSELDGFPGSRLCAAMLRIASASGTREPPYPAMTNPLTSPHLPHHFWRADPLL
ncbi:hypothetical protein ACVIIW_006110 [Bradyrhizobium sp. USDA 4449]